MKPAAKRIINPWLAEHPKVNAEPMTGSHEGGGMRFRYGGFVVNWYATGSVTFQGPGVGTVIFKQLNCKECRGRPKVIQALNYMVRQADKRAQQPSNRVDYHRKLDRRLREARANGRD